MNTFFAKRDYFLAIPLACCVFFTIVLCVLAVDVTVTVTVPAICGNGAIEGAEVCDDGNTTAGDGCSATCTSESSSSSSGSSFSSATPPSAVESTEEGTETEESTETEEVVVEEPLPEEEEEEEEEEEIAICGDGVVQETEQCDDGNTEDWDGCQHDCTDLSFFCGNGFQDEAESCDDGNGVEGDGCDMFCRVEECGNGYLQAGEGCDDGNGDNTDACLDACVVATCGDYYIQTDVEQCDDGNTVDNDGCSTMCQEEEPSLECGDGVVQETEQCDDGNTIAGDGCDLACITEVCGNGYVQVGEGCDDGNGDNTDACLDACVVATCGDYHIQTDVEQCDDGNMADGDGCSALCQEEVALVCGDGLLQVEEECDDGNLLSGDGCSDMCVFETFTFCGDGVQEGEEMCDDGNSINGDGCSAACEIEEEIQPACGDGVLDDGEMCDDGNTRNRDGCSAACTIEEDIQPACGDGSFDAGEECDDGNIMNGDGCSSACVFEIPSICGDGIVDEGESCDDGNFVNQDGCLDTCAFAGCGDGFIFADIEECDDGNNEAGDGCSSFCMSEVVPSCGNDILEADEVCDDGNRFDGDGCSALCAIESKKLALGNFILRLANGAIRPRVEDKQISTLTGDTVQISLDKEFFDEYSVQSMVLQYVVGAHTKKFVDRRVLSFIDPVYAVEEGLLQKQLGFVPQTQRYSSSIELDESGIQDVDIVIRYKDGEVDRVPLQINATLPGIIISDDTNEPLVGSTVTLIDDQSSAVWQSIHFDQHNPTPVSKDGTYGFIVPNGEYILHVEKEGYRTQESFSFRVENNVVNEDVVLMKKLPKLIDSVEDILEEDISAGEKVQKIAIASATKAVEVAKVGVRTVVEVAKKIDDVADDPLVEEVTEEVIIPTTVAASATVVLPSLWSIIIPLLRFLFLQPLLLLGLRKRKEWGVIYNALTKLPIDLAVVRIVNAETKKVVQSRVTDLKGRFLFIVNPGSYMIEVTKPGFSYPSSILQSVKSDGRFADIYHSETIEVTQKGVGLTPNIPVDPVDAEKTPKRIVWEKRLRIVQHIFASSGIYTTMVGLYIAPTLWLCGFLAVHIVVYLLFIHLIQPKQPKGWGIVYDSESGEPLAKAVVRLFNKQYDKLVATFVTDRKGRYAFLVGPSVYYHISEKSGYRELIGPDILVKEKKAEGGIIKTDVHLEKDGET